VITHLRAISWLLPATAMALGPTPSPDAAVLSAPIPRALPRPAAPSELTPPSPVLRVLTLNAAHGRRLAFHQAFESRSTLRDNLGRIGGLLQREAPDVVALQEIDTGSLRSGFLNQVEYLADRAQFPYWYAQRNRDLGLIAQHGNGVLSRIQPKGMEDHKLPGVIPGRGAIVLRLPYGGHEILVVLLHLSLGERSRKRQLEYVAQLIDGSSHVVVMGDMNTPLSRLLEDSALAELDLRPAEHHPPTYPAWSPLFALDHVLVSPNLEITNYEVLNCKLSDHRPIAVEVGARSTGPAQPLAEAQLA